MFECKLEQNVQSTYHEKLLWMLHEDNEWKKYLTYIILQNRFDVY